MEVELPSLPAEFTICNGKCSIVEQKILSGKIVYHLVIHNPEEELVRGINALESVCLTATICLTDTKINSVSSPIKNEKGQTSLWLKVEGEHQIMIDNLRIPITKLTGKLFLVKEIKFTIVDYTIIYDKLVLKTKIGSCYLVTVPIEGDTE